MDPTLITALLTFLTALVPILGTLLGLWINHSRLDAKSKALALDMTASATSAVKAVAQTLTAGQRDPKGNLPAALKEAAKVEALKQAQILLGSDKRAEATAKYGGNGEVAKVLETMVEAALHDVKAVQVTSSTTTSKALVDPAGKVSTVATTVSTTATEPQPQPPSQPLVAVVK